MCGITGIFSNSYSVLNSKIIDKMNSSISHRGPDNSGKWIDQKNGLVFGHQRLSILDQSEAGNQPMRSHSARYVITFNGEIYNHLQIRKLLEKNSSNLKWRSNSDTETLLEAIEYWGLEVALTKLIGMFAFALWDNNKKCLTLARDRNGEKSLYYSLLHQDKNIDFIFSSELKAIKIFPSFKKKIRKDALSLQLNCGYIPSPYSIFEDVFKLKPGHFIILQKKDLEKRLLPLPSPYRPFKSTLSLKTKNLVQMNYDNALIKLDEIFSDVIKDQMISDVPIGAFLSGGTDSSLVVSYMQKLSSQNVKTFSIRLDDEKYSHEKNINKIANYLGTDHTELFIDEKKIISIIPKLSTIYCEPFSDHAQIPTILLSEFAKKDVTVALTGDGADELFYGYNNYTLINKLWNIFKLIPRPIKKKIEKLIFSLKPRTWTKIYNMFINKQINFGDKIYKGSNLLKADNFQSFYLYFNLINFQNSNELKKLIKVFEDLLYHKKKFDNYQFMAFADQLTCLGDGFLTKVDRAAMNFSLETRMPFLDPRIKDFAYKLPKSFKTKKYANKKILRDLLYKHVPRNLFNQSKIGFGFPLETWLRRGPLREWAEELFYQSRLQQNELLDHNLIQKRWREHLSSDRNWSSFIWNVLVFQSWFNENKKIISNQ